MTPKVGWVHEKACIVSSPEVDRVIGPHSSLLPGSTFAMYLAILPIISGCTSYLFIFDLAMWLTLGNVIVCSCGTSRGLKWDCTVGLALIFSPFLWKNMSASLMVPEPGWGTCENDELQWLWPEVQLLLPTHYHMRKNQCLPLYANEVLRLVM